jgi:hypothetical protein
MLGLVVYNTSCTPFISYVILLRGNYSPDLPHIFSSCTLSLPSLLVRACSNCIPCIVLRLAYTNSPSCLFLHARPLLVTSHNFHLCASAQYYHCCWLSTPTAYSVFIFIIYIFLHVFPFSWTNLNVERTCCLFTK